MKRFIKNSFLKAHPVESTPKETSQLQNNIHKKHSKYISLIKNNIDEKGAKDSTTRGKYPYTLVVAFPGELSRIRLISLAIWVSEYILFYPRLRRILKDLPQLKTSSVIMDVGGNRGQSVKFFRSIFKNIEIYSFEPSPKIFRILTELDVSNFRAFNLGISSKNGLGVFYESLLDEASTFDLPNTDSEWHKTKSKILGVAEEEMYSEITVPIKTIDTIVIENQIEGIFLLKIDVEGHEFEVLKGAIVTLNKRDISNIQLERHLDDLRVNNELEIHKFLSGHGFSKIASIKHSIGNFYEDIYTLTNIL
jgi:FkbM family methyltransferase